mmetsp:Transcript_77437/g.199326  ORF Transcript_77437/g.199326 Transcript_77437/m.199326 type:complete len:319 (-) Transcript_77437:180-1136(-)
MQDLVEDKPAVVGPERGVVVVVRRKRRVGNVLVPGEDEVQGAAVLVAGTERACAAHARRRRRHRHREHGVRLDAGVAERARDQDVLAFAAVCVTRLALVVGVRPHRRVRALGSREREVALHGLDPQISRDLIHHLVHCSLDEVVHLLGDDVVLNAKAPRISAVPGRVPGAAIRAVTRRLRRRRCSHTEPVAHAEAVAVPGERACLHLRLVQCVEVHADADRLRVRLRQRLRVEAPALRILLLVQTRWSSIPLYDLIEESARGQPSVTHLRLGGAAQLPASRSIQPALLRSVGVLGGPDLAEDLGRLAGAVRVAHEARL